MTVRIIEERCEWHRKPRIKGYVDMGCFFMSVKHSVQWEIEEAMGASETIVSIVKALREGEGENLRGLTGRNETAYGITEPVEIQKGLGQGDLLSPVRSKLVLAVIQEVMQRLVPGIEFNVKGSRGAPFLIHADKREKANGMVVSILQRIGYKEGDITGWEVVLPDGVVIPQLTGTETYKYLETQLRPGRAV
eukprot:6206454-Pleurochrysis_carterae.AAC.1